MNDRNEKQDGKLSEKKRIMLDVLNILSIIVSVCFIIRQLIVLIPFLRGIPTESGRLFTNSLLLAGALFFLFSAVYRLIDSVQEKKEEKILHQIRDAAAAASFREQAETQNYYRGETRKWSILLIACLIAVVCAVLLLLALFKGEVRPGGSSEVQDVWNAASYIALILGTIGIAHAINKLRDVSRERKGIEQQESRKASYSIYAIVISLGLMLILSLVVYFHNPLVQLEVRYGFRSEAVMKIHPEKDPELAFDYDIYISGIDERLYIDLYYINDSDNRDRFVFPSAFQSDLENEGWIGMTAYNTRIRDGRMEPEWCFIAVKYFTEDTPDRTTDSEDYGKLDAYTQPYRNGYVKCVIRRTEDKTFVNQNNWPWLDPADAGK